MARKLDPAIADILKRHGFGADACWDCHGVWVVYHSVLERIAAKANIAFDIPVVLEANGTAKCVALCVMGRMGDRQEWSIGEAAPGNNKNSYPYAMAEKRAKDRVILKLIGLHGLVYSEEEMNGQDGAPKQAPADRSDEPDESVTTYIAATERRIAGISDASELKHWWNSDEEKEARRALQLEPAVMSKLKDTVMRRLGELAKVAA